MKFSHSFLTLLFLCITQTGAAAEAPRISRAGAQVLELILTRGEVQPAHQVPYIPVTGDRIEERGPNRSPALIRNGSDLGSLVGPIRSLLMPHDEFREEPLDPDRLAKPSSWRLSIDGAPARIVEIHRKSHAVDMARSQRGLRFSVEHHFFLSLEKPLGEGARLVITPTSLPEMQVTAKLGDASTSESIHVSQTGFRPDDPAKQGFLSCWMGDGGGLVFPQYPAFTLVEDTGGKTVFEGKGRLSKSATDTHEDAQNRNYSLADVWVLDFSTFKTPGTYRLVVPGIGCSQSFQVSEDAWDQPFRTALLGLLHQRSGIALAPPLSDFERPRDFHPDDGLIVHTSTATILDTGNGPPGSGWDNFGALVKGATDTVVPGLWGGYHDAGDFDRQTSHLQISRLLLELFELFPDKLLQLRLRIPELGGEQPDLIDEALWGLDFFTRLQTPEGGVRGGIELEQHPRHGEGSWQNSLRSLTYAPDAWTSYHFASVAARAAYVLRGPRQSLAQDYARRALRAYKWAGAQPEGKAAWAVRDARNLAALELYRLLGDERFHKDFLATTALASEGARLHEWGKYDQSESAALYVRLPAQLKTEESLKKACLREMAAEAKACSQQISASGFHWAKSDPGYALGWGRPALPDVLSALRLHALSSNPALLRVAIQACQFALGANPSNLVFTTRLGHRPVRHVFHYDSQVQALSPPSGLCVFGVYDLQANGEKGSEWILKPLREVMYPDPLKWPVLENYQDIGAWPQMNEFTTPMIAQNAFVWGYLALRAPGSPAQ